MTYVKFTNKYGYKECRRLTEEYTISDLEAYGITDVEEITAEEYKEWLTESRVKAMLYDGLLEKHHNEYDNLVIANADKSLYKGFFIITLGYAFAVTVLLINSL